MKQRLGKPGILTARQSLLGGKRHYSTSPEILLRPQVRQTIFLTDLRIHQSGQGFERGLVDLAGHRSAEAMFDPAQKVKNDSRFFFLPSWAAWTRARRL
jgi:hypothetical protein